jgi:hypothetical protein
MTGDPEVGRQLTITGHNRSLTADYARLLGLRLKDAVLVIEAPQPVKGKGAGRAPQALSLNTSSRHSKVFRAFLG